MTSDNMNAEENARLLEKIESTMQSTRLNSDVAAAVNRGLAAVFLADFNAGVAIMRNGGVPMHVMKRVLSSRVCRDTDWKKN